MASGFNFDDDALFKEFDLGSDFGEPELGEGVAKKTARAALDILKESAGPMMQTVKQQLSNELYEASDLFDEGLEVVSDFKRLKDDLAKEIVPAFNTLKIVTRRVLPKAKAFMPKGLYGKTEDYLNRTITTPTREKSAEERQAEYNNATVADSLNTIFARQQQRASAESLQHATERAIDQHLDSARFKTVNRGLSLITGGISGVGSFLQGTFTDYLKKDIELKYRHLFIAKDTYNAIKLTLGVVDRKLEEIKHNTGMPDSLKASDPRYRKGKNDTQSYNDYLYNFRKTFMGNLHTNIMDSVKMVTQLGIPMLDTMTQMGGMGFTIPQLIGKGIGWIGSKYVRGKTNDFIADNQPAFSLLKEFTSNIKDRMTMRVSNWASRTRSAWDSNPFFRWLADMVPEIVADTRVKNDLMNSPDAAATFDVATRQSIVEIIPAHLAFIGKHIRGLSEVLAPGVRFKDVSFNAYRREITSTDQASKDLIDNKLPYAKDIQNMNREAMDSVRRATLQAHKVDIGSERGKQLIDNTNKMQSDLLKFFINSGVRRRFIDLELLTRYLTDPIHEPDDYISDVLDGIDEPVNFVASLLSSITDPETGMIDQMALTTIENAILSYTKKIDISRVAPIISNTYGAANLLRRQGLIGDDGNLDLNGIREFYGKTEGNIQDFYINGKKLSDKELKDKGLDSSSRPFGFGSSIERDAELEKKRQELLKSLIAKGINDPRIEMLQSGNPVLVATAMAIGDQDTFLSKTFTTIGSAGKWIYEKGMNAAEWVSDKIGGGISTGTKYAEDWGLYKDKDAEKLILRSVERLNANRFKCTAASETKRKVVEYHTKHGYAPGKFPNASALITFCKKQGIIVDKDVDILYIDNHTEAPEYDERSYAVTPESSEVVSGSPINVIPTYLQYILEAIYIANGKKKLIPKVNLGRGFGFGGTPAMATVGGPSGPIPSGGAYEPVGSVGANSFFNVPQATVEHYTSGDVVDNFKDLADEVKSTVNDDAHGYFDKLDMYLPSKEGFLSKFTIPEDRQKMDDFWESTVKKNITFKRFLDAFCEELHGSAKVKDGLIMIHRYARSLTDPNEREQYVGDELARAYMVCKNITDPNERESFWDKLRHKAGEKFEELKNSNKKPEEGKGLFGIRDAIKKGWNKFRETRLYKYLSSKIPPEVKERIKREFFKAKEGVKAGWDKAMDELSKWADPEAYKKRRLQEASEKKFMEERVNLTEDGEADPYLQELINEAQSGAPKEKKLSWWQRAKAKFREARRVYKEEREARKAEKEEAKRQRAEEREQERKMREADELIKERKERTEIWEDIKDNIKGLFGISKRKEEKEEKNESLNSSHGKVNRAAKAALSDVSFIGPGNGDAFHSDFLTFATASLKLLDAIRVNAGIGIMSTLSTLISSGAGIVGSGLRGLGSLYGGWLRGAGSVIGGGLRGLGSVAGGVLKSGLPSALIKAGGSIIGGGLRGWGHAVGGTATGLGYAAGGAANLGKGILGTLFGTGSITAAGVMNFGRRIMRPKFIDIYRKDRIEPGKPLLSAKKQEEGVFFADGSRVKNSMDIKAPVFEQVEGDPNPRTLITEADIQAGLCDAKGTPLVENTASYKGVLGGWGGLIANGIGLAATGIGALYGKIFEMLGITIKRGGEITSTILGRLFGIDTEGTQAYQKQMLSNFGMLLELLKSSYYVSYTKEEHDADMKSDERAKKYEDRLDADEQRRRKSGSGVGLGAVGAAVAGASGNATGGSSDSNETNPTPTGSGSSDGSGIGIGEWILGALGVKKLVSKSKDWFRSANRSNTVRGNVATARNLRNRSRDLFRQAEAAEAAGDTAKANKLLERATRAEQASRQAMETARKVRNGERLSVGERVRNWKRTPQGTLINTGKNASRAANAATRVIKATPRAISTGSKWAWKNRGGIANTALLAIMGYGMLTNATESSDAVNSSILKNRDIVDRLYKQVRDSNLDETTKATLRDRIGILSTQTDPQTIAYMAEEIQAAITSARSTQLGETGTSADDVSDITNDVLRSSTARRGDTSARFIIRPTDVGKSVVLDDGTEVTLTAENIADHVGKVAFKTQFEKVSTNVSEAANLGATAITATHGAKSAGSFLGNIASKVPWMKNVGSKFGSWMTGAKNYGAKALQWGSGLLSKVPAIASIASKGAKYLKPVGNLLKIGGKVISAPVLTTIDGVIGGVRGAMMDDKDVDRHYDEYRQGAFGGGHLLSSSGYKAIADAKGFWGTTGAVLRAIGNTGAQVFDVGGNVAGIVGSTKSTINAYIDASRSEKAANTAIIDGEKVSRNELFARGEIRRLDTFNVKAKFGEPLYKLLQNKISIAYREQGAPDHPWGKRCADACRRSVTRAYCEDNKADINYIVAGLDDCINNVGKDEAYTYVYGDAGTIEILNAAKDQVKKYYGSKEATAKVSDTAAPTDAPAKALAAEAVANAQKRTKSVPVPHSTAKSSITDGQSFIYGEFTLTKAELDAAYDKAQKELGRRPVVRTVVQDALIAKYGDKYDSEISSSERRAVLGAIETMYRKSVPTDNKPTQSAAIAAPTDAPAKALVTETPTDKTNRAHNVDLSKPVTVAESSIVKHNQVASANNTKSETASSQANSFDRLHSDNAAVIDRLDILAKLMGANIQAVTNAGDMTRTQVNNGNTNVLKSALAFTKEAVQPLVPKTGLTPPSVSVIGVNKGNTVALT